MERSEDPPGVQPQSAHTDAACCPGCGAVWCDGRWAWRAETDVLNERLCPACHRIRDNAPAGFITLQGRFKTDRLDAFVSLAVECETRERALHPLERIIGIDVLRERVLITTTGIHLARVIARSLDRFHGGKLEALVEDENIFRAKWSP